MDLKPHGGYVHYHTFIISEMLQCESAKHDDCTNTEWDL